MITTPTIGLLINYNKEIQSQFSSIEIGIQLL